jgi:transposase
MTMLADQTDGVIGVDTHRDTLTAAAVTPVGGLLGEVAVAADGAGYQRLLDFARVQVPGRRCFAVEGAGSYGAGLARMLAERGEWVVEVDRPKRPARRGGKTDALDAVRAAREALGQERLEVEAVGVEHVEHTAVQQLDVAALPGDRLNRQAG